MGMNNSRRNSVNSGSASAQQGEVIAEFQQYEQAAEHVEKLVANNFPPTAIAIVGKDLRSVERVRGKLTYSRVAMTGALTGSWLGLIVGFIFGTSIPSVDASAAGGTGSLISALFIGAGIGMLWTVIRYSMSKTKRGFLSQSQVIASLYQVQVPATMVSAANEAIIKANTAKAADAANASK